ncbi:MAG: aldehyde dehydrogenase family protein [Actinomycetales bacterium]|nr:aldehyde dehydrogenase family protein [Actinomycetales bacterium]
MTSRAGRPLGVGQASTPRWVRIGSVPVMVVVGALMSLQALVTGTLRTDLGTGLRASGLAALISMAGSLLVIGVIVLLIPRQRAGLPAVLRAVRSGRYPWWTFVGGAFGGFFVLSQAVAVSVIGVAMFAVAAVAGQIGTSLVVDRHGLGPGGVKAVSRPRVIAAALAVAAVVITSFGGLGAGTGLTWAALALVLMPLVGGAGSAVQQAINGRVSAIGGALPSTLLNASFGLVVLLAFFGAGLLLPGELGTWPTPWWMYASGVIGVIFIGLSAALVHVHGVLTLGLCVIAGQVIGAEILNAVSPTAQVTWASLLAMVLVVVGVLVALFSAGRRTTQRRGPSRQPAAIAGAARTSDNGRDAWRRTMLTDLVPGLMVPTRLFIGGAWVDAVDTFGVVDPATEGTIAQVANASVADAIRAVDAAEAAAPGWAATPPRERAEILRRTFELMTEREEQLAELMVRENGKAFADALGEVRYAAEFFRWYAEEAVRMEGELRVAPSGANRIMVVRQPIGISLLITPWNFPAAMATRKIGPALAAGCTVILKPASETPLTALAVAALLAEAGVPGGVVNVIPSRRSGPVADAVLADPRVRKLSFTGSTAVGRKLLASAAERVISCSMELGGNAPFIVMDDADLDAALEGAMVAKMRNAGEACTAANRFYVHRSVAEDFSRRLGEAMSAQALGPGVDRSNAVGPLVNKAAVEKVVELVEEAVGRGASVLTGGDAPDRDGFYYLPTVLTGVAPGSRILEEEVFGPVAPIVVFDSDEEVLRLANATEFGLVSYVYTADLARGLRVSEALECGMVGLNRGLVSDPAAPFGGVKQSGLGREGGHEGLLEFTESKYIALSW